MTGFNFPEDQPLEHPMVSRAIEQAQVKVEGFNFDARKHLVEYDDVANKQREIIYGLRRKVLSGENLKEEILRKVKREIENLISLYSPRDYGEPQYENIIRGFCEILPFDDKSQQQLKSQITNLKSPEKINEFLFKVVSDLYEVREKQVGSEVAREMEKFAYLSSIDHLWMDHLDALDDLREGIGLRGYGQRDPLVEYKNEAFSMFERLVQQIDYEVVRRIFRIQVTQGPSSDGVLRSKSASTMPKNIQTNIDTSDDIGLVQKPVRKKVGRNDPCPCGSGKKYKKCCYPKYG